MSVSIQLDRETFQKLSELSQKLDMSFNDVIAHALRHLEIELKRREAHKEEFIKQVKEWSWKKPDVK